ncbi:MAG: hypothetical protein JJE21_11250 [Spirochaetaceae bacterium]|nr:hypothetical protein [Spirochaetaceae bacterium]
MKYKNIKFNTLQKIAINNLNISLNLEQLSSDDLECIEQLVGKKIVALTYDKVEEDFNDEIEILKTVLTSIDFVKQI